MDFLREHASLLRRFWQAELRKQVPIGAMALVFSTVMGCVLCLLRPKLGDDTIASFMEMASASGVIEADGSLTAVRILYHNWIALLGIVLYGLLPVICVPAIMVATNGIYMGVILAHYHNQGLSMGLALAGILPHGVFELSALVLAGSTGLCLCRRITDRALHKTDKIHAAALAEDILRVMLLLVFPLLLLSAVTEVYITPTVLSLFL